MEDPHNSPLLEQLKNQVLNLLPQHGRLNTDIELLHLSHLDHSEGTQHCFYSPGIAMIVQGEKKALLGHESCQYSAGFGMVASMDMPSAFEIIGASKEKPFLSLMLNFDGALISECLQQLPPAYAYTDSPGSRQDPKCVQIIKIDDELLSLFLRLLKLHGDPQVKLLAPLTLKELYIRLLTGENSAVLRSIYTRDSHTYKIARAIHYLREHYKEPLDVPALAGMVFMAPSTFFKHYELPYAYA